MTKDFETVRRRVATPDGFELVNDVVSVNDPKSLVVMCHGINSHKLEYLDIFPRVADMLAAEKIASCRFDFRGHGESSGSSLDFSVISQLIDLYAVISDLRSMSQFKNVPLSFFGYSFGAAPGVLSDQKICKFEKICMFAPVISYVDTFLQPQTDWARRSFNDGAFKTALQKGHLLLDGTFKVSQALIEQMKLIDAEKKIATTFINTLIFHGTNDTSVPVEPARRVMDANKNVTVNIIDGMDHGLHLYGDDEGATDDSVKLFSEITSDITRFFSD
jgi:alpha-beta hydrolase superfamily lysophospholipase